MRTFCARMVGVVVVLKIQPRTLTVSLSLMDARLLAPSNVTMLCATSVISVTFGSSEVKSAGKFVSVKPVLVFRDKPNTQAINIALDALKRQKRYSDAIALLQPLVDNFAGDPFVNARYVEMLVRTGASDRAKMAAQTQRAGAMHPVNFRARAMRITQ